MISRSWLLANTNITQQHNVWVAYSGGVDSHVLLDLARQCFTNVRAIHINHNLSASDAQWQQHCETVCAQLNIPLQTISVDATPQHGQSPEEAARLARRAAWSSLLQANDVLLLGHHADDQAETVIFRLLRGSGPKGLSGIKEFSKLGAATIWRPLLAANKQQILEYATANNLQWLEDNSNTNSQFDRNFLRHNIMPLMQQRWPKAVANINRAAKLCGELDAFVAPQIIAATNAVIEQGQVLNLLKLQEYSLGWQQAILRNWLQQQNIVPSQQHLKIIIQQVVNAKADAAPEYRIANKIIRRGQHKLALLDANTDAVIDFNVAWDLQQELNLPNGQTLHVKDVSTQPDFIKKLHNFAVTIRLGNHGHKAKKIFQQHAIPAWERHNYPLVFANNRLVGIVGLWCSNRF